MKTRDALPSDAQEIATVQVASWQAAYSHLLPAEWLAAMSVDERRGKWEEIIANGHSRVQVAMKDGAVVGFASSGKSRDKDAEPGTYELFALYVHPTAWSQGHGWHLWQSVLEAAKRQEAHRCTLWAIVGNDRGTQFYGRLGFVVQQGSRQGFEIAGVPLQEDRYVLILNPNGA